MPRFKLFMAPVRWNQMLLLCHRGRAVTRLKHGRPSLHGAKVCMEQAWILLGYKQNKGCHDTRSAVTMWHFPASVQSEDGGSVGGSIWGPKPEALLGVHPALCWCRFVPHPDICGHSQEMTFFVHAMLQCWILMLWCCVPATHGNKQCYF